MDITPKSFNNEYETTFILKPDLPGDELKPAVDKFIELIKSNDGKVHNIEKWGMRKLAYPIRKHTTGYYTYVEFSAPGTFIERLDTIYRQDDKVMRFLTVKLDKHALAFNKKRREQGFGLRKELKN